MSDLGDTFSRRTQWDLTENHLSRTLAKLKMAGTAILDLTRSNPTECGFSFDQKEIQTAFATPQMLQYRPDPRGLPEAREAVSAYYRNRQTAVSPDDLILTAGTSEAYSFIFRLLCNPGDEVLIPSPGYPLFEFLADLCDVKLIRYPLLYDHGWQIDFSVLASGASPRTRAVVVVHPNNPTGHFTAAAQSSQLLQFCEQRGLALIADEVFLDFTHGRRPEKSFAAPQQETLTFTLSGLSKLCGLPQMKLAWIAVSGPADLKREALARLEVIADAYLSVGTPVQAAAPWLLETRAAFQSQVLVRVDENLREIDARLRRRSGCSRLKSDGGWSAVLRVPAVQADEDLAIALLKNKQVAVHPGHFYDFTQPGHIVVSLIVPKREFAEGIGRVLAFFD